MLIADRANSLTTKAVFRRLNRPNLPDGDSESFGFVELRIVLVEFG